MGHTQNAIADIISKDFGLPVKLSRQIIQKILDIIADDIVYTGEIKFRGLGTFTVTTRQPVDTIHPTTGKPVHIPSKKVVRFRTSIAIRKRLNIKKQKIFKSIKRRKCT